MADAAPAAPGISYEQLALLNASMGHLMRETHLVFMRVLRQRLLPYGITASQWYFLRALWIEEGLTQRELSERASTTSPTTTTAIKLLERDGLVFRKSSPEDRRTLRVYLTEKARLLRDEILPFSAEVNDLALTGVPGEQVELLGDLLQSMRRNLLRQMRSGLPVEIAPVEVA